MVVSTQVLAANAWHHHNNPLKFMISMIIVTGKVFHIASACNNHSDNITETRYLRTVRLLQTKQSPIMLTWRILISCPSLVFALEIYTPYATMESNRKLSCPILCKTYPEKYYVNLNSDKSRSFRGHNCKPENRTVFFNDTEMHTSQNVVHIGLQL